MLTDKEKDVIKDFSEKIALQNDVSPEFVDIVSNNFWDLIQKPAIYTWQRLSPDNLPEQDTWRVDKFYIDKIVNRKKHLRREVVVSKLRFTLTKLFFKKYKLMQPNRLYEPFNYENFI